MLLFSYHERFAFILQFPPSITTLDRVVTRYFVSAGR